MGVITLYEKFPDIFSILMNWWSVISIFLHVSGLNLNLNKMVIVEIDVEEDERRHNCNAKL